MEKVRVPGAVREANRGVRNTRNKAAELWRLEDNRKIPKAGNDSSLLQSFEWTLSGLIFANVNTELQ